MLKQTILEHPYAVSTLAGQLHFSVGGLYGGATGPSVRSARLHKRAELYELARADARTLSRDKHFKIVKIAGDGRCMFRALVSISYILNVTYHIMNIAEQPPMLGTASSVW